MAELPSHSDALCFDEYINDLQDKDFKVDHFISKCRKKVTVECLRKDLDAYYRTLKSAMVELINKDYADFVNLSANLVSLGFSFVVKCRVAIPYPITVCSRLALTSLSKTL